MRSHHSGSELPGIRGNLIRLREAHLGLGEARLALFPWGIYRGLLRPGMPELTMDFSMKYSL